MATNNKYDRQLRLWGAKGQQALGDTTVILLRATAAGTETLKNLVLPGIGSILVVDDTPHSTTQDASSNFFVTSSSDKSRAQVAFELLQELNPDVNGSYKAVESLMDLSLQNDVFDKIETPKTLVVAADLEPPLLQQVGGVCREASVALVVVQSYGLIGSVRLQTPPLPLMQPKPDNDKPDLRLVSPFPSFVALADSINLDVLDDAAHGHVPYPILLYKAAQEWKAGHNSSLPSTFAEKQEFRSIVQGGARKRDLEVNFEEATANAYLGYTEQELDVEHLKSLQTMARDASSPALLGLDCLVTALLAFLERHQGQAPLRGTIPDMTASTNIYVQLQKLYHEKAVEDLAEMKSLLPTDKMITIEDDELEIFCKNVFHLDLLQTRTLEEEYQGSVDDDIREDLMSATWDPYEVAEHTPLLWYISLHACHQFFTKYGRYPGTSATTSYEDDVDPLQDCIVAVTERLGLHETELCQCTVLANEKKYAMEMTRYGNAEIHNVASVVGGVASQEAVKVITGQYIPLNNTYIYNGIASVAGVYNM